MPRKRPRAAGKPAQGPGSRLGRVKTAGKGPAKTLEQAVGRCAGLGIVGRFHPSTPLPAGVDLNEPSHRIKSFEIQNDEFLVAEIEIIDTPSGHALARMWDQGLIEFRPNGYGVINDDKTITDYSIENVSAVLITETVPLTKKVTVKVEFK